MNALKQLQATLDDHKEQMPEGVYLQMCNRTKEMPGWLRGRPVALPRTPPPRCEGAGTTWAP